MSLKKPDLTVYYDGSCPLCRAETDHYRGQVGGGELCFIDVSQPGQVLQADLSREQAMARFHVRRSDGQLVSGAAAFVSIWRSLPRWRWAGRLAGMPGMMALLELGYRLFLPVRPLLSRLAARMSSRSERS